MKIIKNVKVAILLSLCIVFLLTGNVIARNIGEFSNFKISYSGQQTGYLKKLSKGYHVLNLRPSENLAPMRVRHVLLNSDKSERSGQSLLRCGQRGVYSNWASKGYIYSLKMSRENWWDFSAKITGSWSPDNK